MPDPIAALTLTDAELLALSELVTPPEFEEWTRKTLGEYIERLTELKAQEKARALVVEDVAAAKEKFPSVWLVEPVVEEPTAPIEEPQEQT